MTIAGDQLCDVRLIYRVGEITLASVKRSMVVRKVKPFGGVELNGEEPDLNDLPGNAHGVFLRSIPVKGSLPTIHWTDKHIRYVPYQYERFYADLSSGYESYLSSFSSKSRSSLRRKERKFERASGGRIDWRCYRTPREVEEFYSIAREISKETYQERLLDAGLPGDKEFKRAMLERAANGSVRAYVVFLDSKAVAYLYCPIRDGVVLYAYLGYRPEYEQWSPGTVLLWLAMRDLFEERQHRVFDFAEGGDGSKHSQKRLFSTGSVRCADIYLFRRNMTNMGIVVSHSILQKIVATGGVALSKLRMKRLFKRMVRRL